MGFVTFDEEYNSVETMMWLVMILLTMIIMMVLRRNKKRRGEKSDTPVNMDLLKRDCSFTKGHEATLLENVNVAEFFHYLSSVRSESDISIVCSSRR